MADDLSGVNLENAVIDLEIRPDGTVRFHVSGVPGAACERLETVLLALLNSEVVDREHTPEFHQRVVQGLGERLKALVRRG